MHVDVQECGACDFYVFPEGSLDMLKIVKTVAILHIDNQMRPGKFLAVTLTKVVFTILLRHIRAAVGMVFFRLGGA
jgi:hypothetical protein